jgi:5-methylcytosine-specific restriction endonuclease McrA
MALGLKRYFTGKPCKHGHVSERRVPHGNCIDCKREALREWELVNREHINERARARYAANPEGHRIKSRLAARKWRAAHPEEHRAIKRSAKARRRGAEGRHTEADIGAIRKAQKDKCAYCRIKLRGKGHVDHIIAVSCGGTNWPDNLQLTCGHCNVKKSAKCPQAFARELGMLL